jgi:hypothetical protein
MKLSSHSLSYAGLSALLVVGLTAPLDAQLYRVLPDGQHRVTGPADSSTRNGGDTQINVEIFTGKEGVGYQAQRWQETLERAQIFASIRPSVPGDKISIRESKQGRLRQVYIVGRMDRDGSLVFPGRTFASSDSTALLEWINQVKVYGAQGDPKGSPVWGLSKEQFDDLYRALAAPVQQEVADLGFDEAIRGLGLPAEHPFQTSSSADQVLAGTRSRRVRLQLKGFAQGTALAMLLSQYGLGFRPNRTPEGTIELLGVASDSSEHLWPVGWDPPEGSYPAKIAPKLFNQTMVELKEQKLMDVLEAIAEKTSTPIRIDFAQTEPRGLDLENVPVSVRRGRMTWSTLITRAVNPSFLSPKIRTDEANHPFVWITVLPKRAPANYIHVGPRRSPTRDSESN